MPLEVKVHENQSYALPIKVILERKEVVKIPLDSAIYKFTTTFAASHTHIDVINWTVIIIKIGWYLLKKFASQSTSESYLQSWITRQARPALAIKGNLHFSDSFKKTFARHSVVPYLCTCPMVLYRTEYEFWAIYVNGSFSRLCTHTTTPPDDTLTWKDPPAPIIDEFRNKSDDKNILQSVKSRRSFTTNGKNLLW